MQQEQARSEEQAIKDQQDFKLMPLESKCQPARNMPTSHGNKGGDVDERSVHTDSSEHSEPGEFTLPVRKILASEQREVAKQVDNNECQACIIA